MKELESEYCPVLPPKNYYIIRLDGVGFSKFTKKFDKPFDEIISQAMLEASKSLFSFMAGAHAAYTSSDECSILFSDLQSEVTQPWYGGKLNKINSIAASHYTYHFNKKLRQDDTSVNASPAYFDSRCFVIPPAQIVEYFHYRHKWCSKNAKCGFAQEHLSHKTLQNANSDRQVELAELASQISYSSFPGEYRNGTFLYKDSENRKTFFIHKKTHERIEIDCESNVTVEESSDSIRDVMVAKIEQILHNNITRNYPKD